MYVARALRVMCVRTSNSKPIAVQAVLLMLPNTDDGEIEGVVSVSVASGKGGEKVLEPTDCPPR